MGASWEAIYASDWQALWALWLAPAAFLFVRAFHALKHNGPDTGMTGTAALVRLYCIVFAVETMVDPFCTTLLARWLGSGSVATALGLTFVLLGDFRVFLLVLGLRHDPGQRSWPRAIASSALLSAAVPALAYGLFFAGQMGVASELPGRWLWLAHELVFAALALGLRQLWLRRADDAATPRSRFLQAALAYSALYYSLWASADVLILSGIDWGFALRILPNQLYYAFWIPFVWWRFRQIGGGV